MESANVDSASDERALVPKVVFEDDVLLVLDKPSGLIVHADGRTDEPSVAGWLDRRDPSFRRIGGVHTLDSGRTIERHGLLHRIDRETSGLLLVGKTEDAFDHIQDQFLGRSVEKIYRAYVHGKPAKNEGDIEEAIGRSRSDFRRWTTGKDARGTMRPASTHYAVLLSDGEHSEVELSPRTGRTHQLRVHMLALGNPILADSRYGSAPGLGFTRLALHAWRIGVTHPGGSRMVFTAPFPEDFLRANGILEASAKRG